MKNEFITHEQSVKLKLLSFNDPCIGWMADWNKEVHLCEHEPSHHHKSSCNAILKQQFFRWFRENHSIDSWVIPYYYMDNKKYYYVISDSKKDLSDSNEFNSFEEAENACINKLIDLIEARF
jgi:hypothetical protein